MLCELEPYEIAHTAMQVTSSWNLSVQNFSDCALFAMSTVVRSESET